jgi:2-amino-4-hydroxy-6-hydroxymethyldihydropteridine diphosphokinase
MRALVRRPSAPLEAPPQDDFVNAAVVVEGPDDPEKLLDLIARTEAALGRTRTKEVRNAPRTIDIDIVLAETGAYRSARLEIPHPRWRGRRFVVEPAREVAAVFAPFAREIATVSETALQTQRVEKMEEYP